MALSWDPALLALRRPLSAAASSLSGPVGLSQAFRSNRPSRSIDDKRCPIHRPRLHSGARGWCSGEQRKSGARGGKERSLRKREEEREEAVALRRVATSCTKGSDRTSYLTRACCAFLRPLLCGFTTRPFLSSPLSASLPFPFLPCVCSACLLFILSPARTARRFESLFIFISFGLVCRLAPWLQSTRHSPRELWWSSLRRARSLPAPERAGTNAEWRRTVCGQEQVGPTYHHLPRLPVRRSRRLCRAAFSGTVPSSLLYPPLAFLHPFPSFILPLALSHSCSTSSSDARSLLLASSPSHTLPVSSRFIHSVAPPCLPPRLSFSVLPFFRCRFCSLSLSFFLRTLSLVRSFPVFLSLSLSLPRLPSRALTTCVLLAIQSRRKGSQASGWWRVNQMTTTYAQRVHVLIRATHLAHVPSRIDWHKSEVSGDPVKVREVIHLYEI